MSRVSYKGSLSRLSLEALESRQMLAADPAGLAAKGFEAIQWKGETVYAKPNQWITHLDGLKGAAGKQLKAVNGALKKAAELGLKAVNHLGPDGLLVLQSKDGTKLGQVKKALAGVKSLDLDWVEPDFALWADATTPNDTHYQAHQWGLNNTGQTGGLADADIDAPEAWDRTKG